MNAISSIQFDDWEAEQMQDPEFRAEVDTLEPAYQMARWGVLCQSIIGQSVVGLEEAMAGVLILTAQQIASAIHTSEIQLQRFQLQSNLAQRWWISERFAYWLSDKWPERWLPELRFEEEEVG